MDALLWQIVNRSSETEFIFALFHCLLASLTLLVTGSFLRKEVLRGRTATDLALIFGFASFALAFALTTAYSGAEFFLGRRSDRLLFAQISHFSVAAGGVLVTAALLRSECEGRFRHCVRWALWTTGGFALLLAVDQLGSTAVMFADETMHSAGMLVSDGLTMLVAAAGAILLVAGGRRWSHIPACALGLLSVSLVAHFAHLFWDLPWANAIWHIENHLLSLSLFVFAWSAGERSTSLFDRVFVRLNLTFILLASITILTSVGMQRFQYLRMSEERSLGLAEYLRGHLLYYRERGDDLETILQYPEVLRRLVVGFGEIPDFRRLDIHVGGEHATFRYAVDKTITQEFHGTESESKFETTLQMRDPALQATLFRMLRLFVDPDGPDEIQLYGTFDSINRHIGNYIVLIYVLFTLVAGAGIVIVGIIVRSADRNIQNKHSELEAAQQQLAQAAKLASIGELAGGVAHEINNPVTSILSTASHLAEKRRETSLSQRDREQLELITEQAERISGIVGNLLTFSRESRMEWSLVDVSDMVHAALELMQFRLGASNVIVQRALGSHLPLVLADRNRLIEVVVNLINNALDAMPAGGVLSVCTKPSPTGAVCMEVGDTGVGMTPSVLSRIFDPFFTTKEPGRGTGLGLSISHGIVREHKGDIRVESEPGRGSKFIVTLPQHVSTHEEADPDRR